MPSFILDEEEALKDILKGMQVSDKKDATRQVGVWYGQPDTEIRQQSYPYITINLVGINEAMERQHRGIHDYSNYTFDTAPSAGTTARVGELPIPVNLDYQISTYSRQPHHDRQIIGELIGKRIPMRYGVLLVKGDNTIRRLDFLGIVKRDTTESAKRLFVNHVTVRISSEILPVQLQELRAVTQINTTYTKTDTDWDHKTAINWTL
jgi:hypothetical protein